MDNERALAPDAPGRLWAVLGDSSAQAIGASAYDRGWVGLVRRELPDPQQWRVLNVSRSGARTRDVLTEQWPLVAALPRRPDLVTVVVGGNDLTHTPLGQWLADLRSLLAVLPRGAVVATTPRGWREPKAVAGNALIRAEASGRGLVVADLWARTGPPWRGQFADGFHPNDAGYRRWAVVLVDAVERALATDAGR